MGKPEEYVVKKKSKAIRKRKRSAAGEAFSSRHGIEATKRRRRAGTRRICEGMCYTLPTPDDPFNERGEKRKRLKKTKDKVLSVAGKNLEFFAEVSNHVHGGKDDLQQKRHIVDDEMFKTRSKVSDQREPEYVQAVRGVKKITSQTKINSLNIAREGLEPSLLGKAKNRNEASSPGSEKIKEIISLQPKSCPWHSSVMDCLGMAVSCAPGSITSDRVSRVNEALALARSLRTLSHEGKTFELKGGEAIQESESGCLIQKQFWGACEMGSDVLVSCEDEVLRMLSYVPAAMLHFSKREQPLSSASNPFLLFLVTSQDKAINVRKYCRALKIGWNLQSVSLHTGKEIEQQIEGLNLKMPELVVATPDRLIDLVNVKIISLENVSLLVIDSLEDMVKHEFTEQLSLIRSKMKVKVQTFVFSGRYHPGAIKTVQCLLRNPIQRVEFVKSVPHQSACISQIVTVMFSNDRKLPKLLKILKSSPKKESSLSKKGFSSLVLVQSRETACNILKAIRDEGLSVELVVSKEISPERMQIMLESLRTEELQVLIMDHVVAEVDLSRILNIVNYDFPHSMQEYCDILTRMARFSVFGELHSLCTSSMVHLAGELIEVLCDCSQPIPKALQMLADAYTCVSHPS